MIKTLETTLKMDREKYTVPRKVQDYIPIRRIWSDGVFLVGNKYAKTFLFSDINYFAASPEDQVGMLKKYQSLLNSLDCTSTTKITVNNRRIDLRSTKENVFMPIKGDALDEYRREYNRMLSDAVTGTSIIKEKYATVSVHRKNVEEARVFFRRIEAEMSVQFASLGSKLIPLDAVDKLRILHDFYRPGDESCFALDLKDADVSKPVTARLQESCWPRATVSPSPVFAMEMYCSSPSLVPPWATMIFAWCMV